MMIFFRYIFNLGLENILIVSFDFWFGFIIDWKFAIFILDLTKLPSIRKLFDELSLFVVVFEFASHDDMQNRLLVR